MGYSYEKIVRYLYSRLPVVKEVVETPRCDILEAYYNNKYPTSVIEYSGRVLPGSNTRFKIDVRDFFSLDDNNLNNIITSLKMDAMTDNQKALTCLKWIISNFPYKGDNSNYGLGEFWSTPYESLNRHSGDCEDGAILLANMLLVAGVPSWKVRVNAGNVISPTTKVVSGHAYLTFFDEIKEKWVILDWCYYPNLDKVEDREEYKKDLRYDKIWFSFNNKNSWAATSGDVRNMPGFE